MLIVWPCTTFAIVFQSTRLMLMSQKQVFPDQYAFAAFPAMWSSSLCFKLVLIFVFPRKTHHPSPWNLSMVLWHCVWWCCQCSFAVVSILMFRCSITVRMALVSSWCPRTCSQDHASRVFLIAVHVACMRSKCLARGLLFQGLKHWWSALSPSQAILICPPAKSWCMDSSFKVSAIP